MDRTDRMVNNRVVLILIVAPGVCTFCPALVFQLLMQFTEQPQVFEQATFN